MKSKTSHKTSKNTRPKRRKAVPLKSEKSDLNHKVPARKVAVSPVSDFKVCQEVEVGDIGGFGDSQELEQHEKKCGDRATEYCTGCGKNLCRIHYMLMHGDHDVSERTGQGLAQ